MDALMILNVLTAIICAVCLIGMKLTMTDDDDPET